MIYWWSVKLHHKKDITCFIKKFNMSRIDKRMDEQTDNQRMAISNWRIILIKDMLMVICVKFNHDRTSTSVKNCLIKNITRAVQTEGWTNILQTIHLLYFVWWGIIKLYVKTILMWISHSNSNGNQKLYNYVAKWYS